MKRTLFVMVLLLSACGLRAQQLAVGTDIPALAMGIYNGGAELTVGNRSTIGVSLFGAYHPWISKSSKAIGIQPEYRYYFGGRPMYHHYVGIGLLAVNYDFKWKEKRYDGDAVGAGLTFGYVVSLGRRFSLDAHAGVGLLRYHHQENGVESLESPIECREYVMMPTKIGVTLSYILR